jgi:hypothetical protein
MSIEHQRARKIKTVLPFIYVLEYHDNHTSHLSLPSYIIPKQCEKPEKSYLIYHYQIQPQTHAVV